VDRSTDDPPANQATSDTPNEAMETRRQQSEAGRKDELERARQGQESRREGDASDGKQGQDTP
jgi:hypothetical protein